MPGRGLLRALIVLAAAAGAAVFVLRKLGVIGGNAGGAAIEYADPSVDDGEDEAANE